MPADLSSPLGFNEPPRGVDPLAVLTALKPAVLLVHRLQEQRLDDDLELLLPDLMFPMLTTFYGLRVRHLPGLPAPRLAHAFPPTSGRAVVAALEAEFGPVNDEDMEQVRRMWPTA